MMKLYSELAPVYDEMYRSIFDYEMEARFYDGLLAKYGRRSVLEIGCGGGHLVNTYPLLNTPNTG